MFNPRLCNQCGKSYEPKRKWQVFCSPKCRNDSHNEDKQPIKKPMTDKERIERLIFEGE